MDLVVALTFFIVMFGLAALPSSSVLLVVTRSATHGVKHGIAVAGGIVVGDLAFVCLVLLGMSVLAETMGVFFAILKHIGGAYLIWLGYSLICSKLPVVEFTQESGSSSSLIVSMLTGLALTLGDLKAILFYASLFPNLFEATAPSATDIAVIITATIFTVGGAKVMYAVAARRLVERASKVMVTKYAPKIAGGILVGTGTYLLAKS